MYFHMSLLLEIDVLLPSLQFAHRCASTVHKAKPHELPYSGYHSQSLFFVEAITVVLQSCALASTKEGRAWEQG